MLITVKVLPATNTKPTRYSVKALYFNKVYGESNVYHGIFPSDYEFSHFQNMENAARKMAEKVYASTCGKIEYLGKDCKEDFFQA
jgi:hypothetical protein